MRSKEGGVGGSLGYTDMLVHEWHWWQPSCLGCEPNEFVHSGTACVGVRGTALETSPERRTNQPRSSAGGARHGAHDGEQEITY